MVEVCTLLATLRGTLLPHPPVGGSQISTVSKIPSKFFSASGRKNVYCVAWMRRIFQFGPALGQRNLINMQKRNTCKMRQVSEGCVLILFHWITSLKCIEVSSLEGLVSHDKIQGKNASPPPPRDVSVRQLRPRIFKFPIETTSPAARS